MKTDAPERVTVPDPPRGAPKAAATVPDPKKNTVPDPKGLGGVPEVIALKATVPDPPRGGSPKVAVIVPGTAALWTECGAATGGP
jgi:hypothetical protein